MLSTPCCKVIISLNIFSVGRSLTAIRSLHQTPVPPHSLFNRFKSHIIVSTNHGADAQKFSRFSANNIMTGSDTFRISDYDMVGFDLDNTLVRYKVAAMVELEYRVLVEFLIDRKGYSSRHLLKPISEDLDFLQKGLIVDMERGNILKVSANGFIRAASHGTRPMEDAAIRSVYGEQRMWDTLVEYTGNLLSTWNGPASQKMRSLLDYFDMPASLVFARCVDALDEEDGATESYLIWPDILEGIYALYSRELFQSKTSPYFEELKQRLDNYVYVSDPKVLTFLKELKQHKTTFLLTGSHVDFANLTATHALGSDWKTLFDFVICFGKKPGFFIENRPFQKLDGVAESGFIEAKDIELDQVYTQGNMTQLLEVLRKKPNAVADPKVLYIGDNLIQDVYTPFAKRQLDTIAVSEELLAEGQTDCDQVHEDAAMLSSERWGSYFGSASEPTLWTEVIRQNAKLCVADVAVLAENPLDYEYKCFTHEKSCVNGFYPSDPKHF